jgi:L-asparaginase II
MNMEDKQDSNELIIEVLRGKVVESRHRVSLAVVNSQRQLYLAFGDMTEPIFMRSSAKPFQALPIIEKGFALQLDLSPRQVALICASHAGTDEHAEVAASILAKMGLSETSLQCGTHTPYDRNTSRRLLIQGELPSALRHNCSGKHAAMILLARCLDEDIDNYLHPDHQVQREILKAFSEMVAIDQAEIELGTDGCSAPNFAVPLPAAAYGYACLMDPSHLNPPRKAACQQIVQVMLSHPEMVAGAGEFDTELMQASNGRILSKGGAEGYQALGITSGIRPEGGALGIVLKVHDGDGGKRARSVACLAVLRAMHLMSAQAHERLADFDRRNLYNFRKIGVGEIRLENESLDRLLEAYERV